MSPNDHSFKPRTEKLRTSCDSCHLSKIKCSRGRPLCSRCLICGTDCTYSPSARVGRKSKKGGQASSNAVTHTRNTPSGDHSELQWSSVSSPSSPTTPFYDNGGIASPEFDQSLSYSTKTPSTSGTITPAPPEDMSSLQLMDLTATPTSESWIQSPETFDYVSWGTEPIHSSFSGAGMMLPDTNTSWGNWYSTYMDQAPYFNSGAFHYPAGSSTTFPQNGCQSSGHM